MKKTAFLFLSTLIIQTVSGQICQPQLYTATEDGNCNSNPYVLVFEDNFNGNSLDTTKWQIQPWGQGSLTGDNSQQYYTLENVTVASGICTITAKRDTVLRRAVSWLPDDAILTDSLPNLRTYYYTSSNLWTYAMYGYGMYEIRCKIPTGKGFWPAFWMYGRDTSGSREIDVFEYWDDNTHNLHMTLHVNGEMCTGQYVGPDYASAFHTFKVIWNPYKVEWFVDDTLRRRITRFHNILGHLLDCESIAANTNYIIEKVFPADTMHIITNLAIQTGTFAPDSTTVFPVSLDIDFIRYYQQSPGSGIEADPLAHADDAININTYPNPANGSLSIAFRDTSKGYAIHLLDAQGDRVFSSTSTGENIIHIDVSRYSKGMYLLHILDPAHQKYVVRKVVIQ